MTQSSRRQASLTVIPQLASEMNVTLVNGCFDSSAIMFTLLAAFCARGSKEHTIEEYRHSPAIGRHFNGFAIPID